MRRLLLAVRAAASGGRFLSVWSLVLTAPLSLTIMAPVGAGVDVGAVAPATALTTAGFVLALGLLAALERRLPRRRVRAVSIVVGIVVCAALRPVVQDAWASALGLPAPAAAPLPFRIATNVVVLPVVLAVVAVLENALRTLRRSNALLREVAHELAAAGATADPADRVARPEVEAAASALTVAVERLGMHDGTDPVRELGAVSFRAWSHRLQHLADEPLAPGDAVTAPAPVGPPGRGGRRRLPPFRLPPRGAVTVVYIACTLPYALRTSTPSELAVGLLAVALAGAIVDGVSRRLAPARSAHAAAATDLGTAHARPRSESLLALADGHHGVVAVLPAVDYLAFSLAGGLCAGALHALRREQRRLSGAVAHAQRATREGARPVREGLRRTAELLHREGQGACVQFVLVHPPGRHRRSRRRQHPHGAHRHPIPPTNDPAGGGGAAAALAARWHEGGCRVQSRCLRARGRRGDRDRDPWAARDAYDVVAEGLLNAVKHSGQKRARVLLDVAPTGAGPRLRVEVRSFGTAPAGAQLRPASHVRDLGARLRAEAGGAVLEAALPLAPAPPVVSAEHRGEAPTPGS
ncbi:hypothetical protein [Microbacterium hominis]|uniref:hypothetical protein n=1 Tax=Microbacterium hominis TaxID=162426 RepID=UPI000768748B|nr:hypothetical protein [Microbacterium hominis]KXC05576.1 hypothetical protein MhomT_10145 [Microbacterium hominis]